MIIQKGIYMCTLCRNALAFIVLLFNLVSISHSSDLLFRPYKPSFPCKKATTEIEKTICNESELSALDAILSNTYKAAKSSPQIKDLRKEQLLWLTQRNKCNNGNTYKCLLSIYTSRIRTLNREYNLSVLASEYSYFTKKYALQSNVETGNNFEVYANILFKKKDLIKIEWNKDNEIKSSKWTLDRRGYYDLVDGECGLPGHCEIKKIKLYKDLHECLVAKDSQSNAFISIKNNKQNKCTNISKLVILKDTSNTITFSENELILKPKHYNKQEFWKKDLKLSDKSDVLLHIREKKSETGIHSFQSIIKISPKNQTATSYHLLTDEKIISDFHGDQILINIDSGRDYLFNTVNTDRAGNSLFIINKDGIPLSIIRNSSPKIKSEISPCTQFLGVDIREKIIKFYTDNSTVCGGFTTKLIGTINEKLELNIDSYSNEEIFIGNTDENIKIINHEFTECDIYSSKAISCDINDYFMEARLYKDRISLVKHTNNDKNLIDIVPSNNDMIHSAKKKLDTHPRIISKIQHPEKKLTIEIKNIDFKDEVNIKLRPLPSYYNKDYDYFDNNRAPKKDLGYYSVFLSQDIIEKSGKSYLVGIENAFSEETSPNTTSEFKGNERSITIPLNEISMLAISDNEQCLSISISVKKGGNTFLNYIPKDNTEGRSTFCFKHKSNISRNFFEEKDFIINNEHSNYSIVQFNGESYTPYTSRDSINFKILNKYEPIIIDKLDITKLSENELSKITFQSINGEDWCKIKSSFYSKDIESLIILTHCGGSHPWEEISIINNQGQDSIINGLKYHQYCYRCERIEEININDIELYKAKHFYVIRIDHDLIIFDDKNRITTTEIKSNIKQTLKAESRNFLTSNDDSHTNNNSFYSFGLESPLKVKGENLAFSNKTYNSRFFDISSYRKQAIDCIDRYKIDSLFENKSWGSFSCNEENIYLIPDTIEVSQIGKHNSEEEELYIKSEDHHKIINLNISITDEPTDFSNYKKLNSLKLFIDRRLDPNKIRLINLPNSIIKIDTPILLNEINEITNLKELTTELIDKNFSENNTNIDLEKLTLKECNSYWPKFKNIKSVKLTCHTIKKENIPPYESLNTIELIGDISKEAIEYIYKLKNVKNLKLTPRKKETFEIFKSAPSYFLENITSLDIHRNNIKLLLISDLSFIKKMKSLQHLGLAVDSLIGLGDLTKDIDLKSFHLDMHNDNAYEYPDINFIYNLKELSIKNKFCLNSITKYFKNLISLKIKDSCFFGSDKTLSKFLSLSKLEVQDSLDYNFISNTPKPLKTLKLSNIKKNEKAADPTLNFNFDSNPELRLSRIDDIELYRRLSYQDVSNIKIGSNRSYTRLVKKDYFLTRLKSLNINNNSVNSILESCIKYKDDIIDDNNFYSTSSDCILDAFDRVRS